GRARPAGLECCLLAAAGQYCGQCCALSSHSGAAVCFRPAQRGHPVFPLYRAAELPGAAGGPGASGSHPAVLDFRQSDGANEAGGYADTTSYAPVNKPLVPFFATPVEDLAHPDRWQPLTYLTDDSKPATPPYIAPHWGGVKPFALSSG
nr:hypothetical protein [Tanacetum cinerariifolium]